jgi:hypothetical protein
MPATVYTPSDIVYLHAEKFLADQSKAYRNAKWIQWLIAVIFVAIGIWMVSWFIWNSLYNPGSDAYIIGETQLVFAAWMWLLLKCLMFGLFIPVGIMLLDSSMRESFVDARKQPGSEKCISPGDLLFACIKTAVYAHLDAGDIELTYVNDELIASPGTSSKEWPRHSLEDRLNFLVTNRLQDIFGTYQTYISQKPSARMLERVEAGLIVRGIIKLNDEDSFIQARKATEDQVDSVLELVERHLSSDLSLDQAIGQSLVNAIAALTYVKKSQNDGGIHETNIWDAEVDAATYATSPKIRIQQKVFMVYGGIFVVTGILLLIALGGVFSKICLLTIGTGLAVQFPFLLRILPFEWSRKRREAYLASFYDAEVKKTIVDTHQRGMRSVSYVVFAVLITGALLCIPVYIYAGDHQVISIVAGIILYGAFFYAWQTQRSKIRKARNKALLGEALSDIDKITPQPLQPAKDDYSDQPLISVPFSLQIQIGKEIPEVPEDISGKIQSFIQSLRQGKTVPLHLLALRVFGSRHMENFIGLAKDWLKMGAMLRLDGPDTVDDKKHTLEELENTVVKNLLELESAVASFQWSPDADGLFTINSIQCSNAVWKEAIRILFGKASIIVMDLSALSSSNKGIAYELRKMINEVPLQKVLFIVDHTTDRVVLHELFTEICSTIRPDSPNAAAGHLLIQVLDTGGGAERYPDETMYEWQKRTSIRINGEQLVAHLYTTLFH